MAQTEKVLEGIRTVDARLLVAGERLRRYRNAEQVDSVTVQTGVVNRMLDERSALMKERDRG